MESFKPKLTKVNRDINGNPRYVVHFLALLKETCKHYGGVEQAYNKACKAANKIGGAKYRGKKYSGCIVFQCHNTETLIKNIYENRI